MNRQQSGPHENKTNFYILGWILANAFALRCYTDNAMTLDIA